MSSLSRHGGFSLVELMVAMLLGMLITAAAVSLFSTNQRTFQLQQARSQIEEQGQLAMRFIAGDVRMAGFVAPNAGSVPMSGIVLASSSDGGTGGSDQLAVTHHGDTDCEGDPATTVIVNTYWVDQDGDLMCKGNQKANSGVKLLSGVSSFQVLYGVDKQADGTPFAGQYVTASGIGAQVVLAVRISLLLEETVNSLGSGSSKTYYLLNEDVTVDPTNTLFGQFSTTVALRNYPWEAI